RRGAPRAALDDGPRSRVARAARAPPRAPLRALRDRQSPLPRAHPQKAVVVMLRRVRRAGKEALLMSRPGWFWAYVKWRHGLLEPEMDLVPLLCQKHKVSVDVGASDGAYTYLLEQHSRAVV